MRVLVTGGRGYIGGRLVRTFSDNQNFDLTVVSRGRSRTEKNAILTVDWRDSASIEAMCQNQDSIVHLAAMNEAECESSPEEAIRINALAVMMLVRSAAAAGVARLIYLSTIKVFGNDPTGVLSEKSLPNPVSHYAITHRAAEDYVLAASKKRRLQGIVLRLSNGLGPPSDPSLNIWSLIANDLCRQAATSRRILLKSSGLASRNFIGMADVIEAIRHALTMPENRVGDGLFHLGGQGSCQIWELAQLIQRRAESLFGDRVELERASPAPNEQCLPLDWCIEKLMDTGWAPSRPLHDEIDETLLLCRKKFGKAAA